MKYYFCKLHGPRPTFGQDLTPEEMMLMREHGAYLRTFAAKRQAVAFGPVVDPQGNFGVGLWELPDDVDINAICTDDPVIKSNRGFRYEILPMMALVSRG